MRYGILGPLEVRTTGGDPVALAGARPRALLVLLLLDPGRVVGMDRLIDGQYGDDPPAGAANAVQAQISRLRRALPDGAIEFHRDGYRIACDPEDVDAHRFTRLAQEGRALLAAGNHPAAAAALRPALELWRGPALADLPHGVAEAARLADLRLGAAEDLAEAELALPGGTAVADLRALVAANPLRERLRGLLMRALHAAGRQAEALAEYEQARRLLADELGADPSPELAAVHLGLLRAERATAPARTRPGAQLTSFVGRDTELDRLAGLRAQGVRLVTLLGPGGAGKTRLAVEFARRTDPDACFADLSALSAADGEGAVPQTVLAALGLRESGFQPGGDPVRRLTTALAAEPVPLVLDNCEQVIAGVAGLARVLLAGCPGLTVLATSREPLGLTGEALLPVSTLDTEAAAVRLFGDRAAAVRPGFTVGPDNTAEVAAVCAALDGLPLAIELAAARLRQFTVAEIAARLAEDGRFRLLSRGDRTAAARHRTLHAVVAWSWDLLGPAEQRLARRFAVFTGGAPLAAVEAVCAEPDAVDLLADLVDRSLVETDGSRYRMLDTIRLFCAEQLAAAGETGELHRAHARYHLDLAQRADPHLRRAEQLTWLAALSAEHGNLMAALRWSAREDRPTGFRLVAALAAYWWLSGRRGQAGPAAAELLAGTVPAGLDEEYVSCVVHAVPRPAAEHWDRAAAIMRTPERPLRHPFGAAVWGMSAGPAAGQDSDASPLLGTDPWNLALARLGDAVILVLNGGVTDGERELRTVLAEFRELGERWGIAQGQDWLGTVASWRGEWQRAEELWAEALDLLGELGALEERGDAFCHRGEARLRRGDLAGAATDLATAAELLARGGRPDALPGVHLCRAELARCSGDPDTAARELDAALTGAGSGAYGAEARRAQVLAAQGRLARDRRDDTTALARYRAAAEAAGQNPVLRSDAAVAAECRAAIALLSGGPDRCAFLLGTAVALRGLAVTGDPAVTELAAAARTELGPTPFATAYAHGAAQSPAEARAQLR